MNDPFTGVEAAPPSSNQPAAIKPLKIAVIDTGVDLNHPYLNGLFWINPGESGTDSLGTDKANNGIDDDGNGYVDDVHGWNFVNQSNDLTDHSGHGTHISGIIKSSLDKDYGLNFQPSVELITLKYYDPTADNNKSVSSFTEAVLYATALDVDIINISGGGPYFNQLEWAALKEANEKGILVVAASGNKSSQEAFYPFYPAYYELDNIVSVTATSLTGQLLKTSNFHDRNVDVAAPGENIYSSLPGNRFGRQTGTSQATAFVTGTAAWIMSVGFRETPKEVKALIIASGSKTEFLEEKLASVQLNPVQAVTSLHIPWTPKSAENALKARVPASSVSQIK